MQDPAEPVPPFTELPLRQQTITLARTEALQKLILKEELGHGLNIGQVNISEGRITPQAFYYAVGITQSPTLEQLKTHPIQLEVTIPNRIVKCPGGRAIQRLRPRKNGELLPKSGEAYHPSQPRKAARGRRRTQ